MGGGADLRDEDVAALPDVGELVALGLGEEIDRPALQGRERDVGPVLGEGADHDHRGVVRGLDQGEGFEPGHPGHFDVERDHVGFEFRRPLDGLGAIARDPDDLDPGLGPEQVREQLAHQGRVVHDQDADACALAITRAHQGPRGLGRVRADWPAPS